MGAVILGDNACLLAVGPISGSPSFYSGPNSGTIKGRSFEIRLPSGTLRSARGTLRISSDSLSHSPGCLLMGALEVVDAVLPVVEVV